MTYGELKVITMQKLFSSWEGEKTWDEDERQYLLALPAAANEAIQHLYKYDAGVSGEVIIEHEPVPGQAVARYGLKKFAGDFYRLREDAVSCEKDGKLNTNPTYGFDGQNTLLIYDRQPGMWRVRYWAQAPKINAGTLDDFVLPISEAAAQTMPLYIASQLYKDEDIQLATTYRNEFEIMLERLPKNTIQTESFVSERRWI